MYSDRTMEAMDVALRGGQGGLKPSPSPNDPSGEFQAVSKPFPDEYRIEDTCCGRCPVGTTCYVDLVTGA